MRIWEALKIKKKKQYIGSVKCGAHKQNRNTLTFWLLEAKTTTLEKKTTMLEEFLEAVDWVIEGESK